MAYPGQPPGYGGAPQYGAPPGHGYGAPPPPSGYPGELYKHVFRLDHCVILEREQFSFFLKLLCKFCHNLRRAYGQPGPAAMDPQVQQWFMSVDTDRSGRITAQELQRALINTNWTQFNMETCRLMVGMFDKDMSGTIDLYEFQALWHYIQQWKNTFDRYDSNKSGSIESHELHQAFQTMGYNVSPQFVHMVVVKFDHYGRRCLTLDNFIQASVMLKCLTDSFKQRDTSMTGSVRMSYEDFMSLAVLYKP